MLSWKFNQYLINISNISEKKSGGGNDDDSSGVLVLFIVTVLEKILSTSKYLSVFLYRI